MNILASPLPAAVEIGGARIPIRTSHRVGIQVARTLESDIAPSLKGSVILGLYFPDMGFNDPDAALDAALEFFQCGRPVRKRRKGKARALDWDHDASTILADFRREYGIDLTDPATTLHWWAFMAYFEGLTPESGIQRAMYYRAASPPYDSGKEAVKHFKELRRAYALPPKTDAEVIAAEAAMWGDTSV